MNDFDDIDFFTDPALVPNPHPYFDYLRAKGPVAREPHHGVVAITGYDEAMALYKDVDSFSSCIAVGGPFPPLPFEPSGDDIGDLIDQHRMQMPLHEHMVTMDPPEHTRARSVLSRLLTPARLKENQDFLWHLADQQLDEFVGRGECEFLDAYSKPYALLAVANLLGCPKPITRNSVPHSLIRTPRATWTTTRPRSTRWNSSTKSSAPTSKTGAASRATTC